MGCKYQSWLWVNKLTGETRPYFCMAWTCEEHQGRAQWHWATMVAAFRPTRMVTVTNVPADPVRARLGWSHLVQQIRRRKGRFSYARFLEAGSDTGMLHWHVAQRGAFVPQRWLSRHCDAVGLGKVVDIRACEGKGPAWYVSKYITKEGAPEGWRKVTTSLDFPRPEYPEPEPGWFLFSNNREDFEAVRIMEGYKAWRESRALTNS